MTKVVIILGITIILMKKYTIALTLKESYTKAPPPSEWKRLWS